MKNLLAIVTGFVGLLLVVVLISLFFIKLGWSLFMVPVFGLPELTWMQTLGLSLLAGCFRSSGGVRKSD